jgi:hypothetical protein
VPASNSTHGLLVLSQRLVLVPSCGLRGKLQFSLFALLLVVPFGEHEVENKFTGCGRMQKPKSTAPIFRIVGRVVPCFRHGTNHNNNRTAFSRRFCKR